MIKFSVQRPRPIRSIISHPRFVSLAVDMVATKRRVLLLRAEKAFFIGNAFFVDFLGNLVLFRAEKAFPEGNAFFVDFLGNLVLFRAGKAFPEGDAFFVDFLEEILRSFCFALQ